MNQSKSEKNKGSQKTEENPDLLQTVRELLSNGKPKVSESNLTAFHLHRRKEAIKAVEEMSKNPWTAEELKNNIATLKENIQKMNEESKIDKSKT